MFRALIAALAAIATLDCAHAACDGRYRVQTDANRDVLYFSYLRDDGSMGPNLLATNLTRGQAHEIVLPGSGKAQFVAVLSVKMTVFSPLVELCRFRQILIFEKGGKPLMDVQ